MTQQDKVSLCRDTALSILKPSARDLEYGLALHKEALVVESYGLGLHAPVDMEQLQKFHESGASGIECQDMMEDMIMTGWLADAELRQEYLDAWELAGVNCIFLNAGEEQHDPARLLKRTARYILLTDTLSEKMQRVTSVEGILAAWEAGKYSLCLTTNGVPLSGKRIDVEEELSPIRMFAQLGVKMMHLTYNRANLIGDGCAEARNAGLTDFGHHVVRELNRRGILIDLAHSGWQTTLDTVRVSSKPVVISHAAAWQLHQHIRCKSDEVIRAVVDAGGTIGVTNIPYFLGRTGNIAAFLDHVDYLVQKFGPDAVTIGMDSVYSSRRARTPGVKARVYMGARKRWEDFWPEGQDVFAADWNKPEQVNSLAWTNWPLFTVGMVQRGHSDETIRKILGLNILRVAQEAWNTTADKPNQVAGT